ncbi:hypothetical protein LRS74_16885 [Streptomyces sp. LX-29]|uniref:hypothetical protein n=1 Tax=Streptomyces sp. LX-29 TaxID=2900152 RepID=UPI00240DD9A4|nr:hypothetical protein [Streptomyces sp. LX-29]WFB08534.1 hypothetical protein LRS74_16885 [Streptomyces sp. LX-29]
MSNGSTERPHTRPARTSHAWLRTAVCIAILIPCNLVIGYFTFVAYEVEPSGPWDKEAVFHSQLASGMALGACVLLSLPTLFFTATGWLRAWWCAIPGLMAVAAVLRLTLLAPTV